MKDCEFINKNTLAYYCNTNEHLLKTPAKALVIEFPGLGGSSCLGGYIDRGVYETDYAKELADNGILLAYTFPGPWSWMNPGAVRYADILIDALFDKFGLPADANIVATGGSMGGLGALIFTASSRHDVTACAAACPCYDALRFFDAHPDFPRTFISAVSALPVSFETGLKLISPIYRISDMPSVPYYIVCDELDECFEAEGMKVYADMLREKTGDVEFRFLPGQGHGGFTPEERQMLTDFVVKNALGK